MANSHDGNAQVLSYPQHPPKDFSDLAATLIKNGLGGVDAETLVVPEKLRTLDHGRPWSDDQFASTRLSSNRDMSR